MTPYYKNYDDSWVFLTNYNDGENLDVYFCPRFRFANNEHQVVLVRFGSERPESTFLSVGMLESMGEVFRRGNQAFYVGLQEAKRRGLISPSL